MADTKQIGRPRKEARPVLSPQQLKALCMNVANFGSPLKAADVARKIGVTRSAVSKWRRDKIYIAHLIKHLAKEWSSGVQARRDAELIRLREFTEISARLAEMAKRLDSPVLALAQLNRGVEARDDKRPQLADLRESGSKTNTRIRAPVKQTAENLAGI